MIVFLNDIVHIVFTRIAGFDGVLVEHFLVPVLGGKLFSDMSEE